MTSVALAKPNVNGEGKGMARGWRGDGEGMERGERGERDLPAFDNIHLEQGSRCTKRT